jgi:hypothetical protein
MEVPAISALKTAHYDGAGGHRLSETVGKTQSVETAKYVNPRIFFDPETGKVVVQIRDTSTGEVREQYPPDLAAHAYERAAAAGIKGDGIKGEGGEDTEAPLPGPSEGEVEPAIPGAELVRTAVG